VELSIVFVRNMLPYYLIKYQTEEKAALRKQGLNEKTAASVLLKLFISGNERCHTTDAP